MPQYNYMIEGAGMPKPFKLNSAKTHKLIDRFSTLSDGSIKKYLKDSKSIILEDAPYRSELICFWELVALRHYKDAVTLCYGSFKPPRKTPPDMAFDRGAICSFNGDRLSYLLLYELEALLGYEDAKILGDANLYGLQKELCILKFENNGDKFTGTSEIVPNPLKFL